MWIEPRTFWRRADTPHATRGEEGRRGDSASDTPIMILRTRIDKGLQDKDLGNCVSGCCTYRCTQIEVDEHFAQIIAAWPSLSVQQRQAASAMVLAMGAIRSEDHVFV
jgi:hypothetical protein